MLCSFPGRMKKSRILSILWKRDPAQSAGTPPSNLLQTLEEPRCSGFKIFLSLDWFVTHALKGVIYLPREAKEGERNGERKGGKKREEEKEGRMGKRRKGRRKPKTCP